MEVGRAPPASPVSILGKASFSPGGRSFYTLLALLALLLTWALVYWNLLL